MEVDSKVLPSDPNTPNPFSAGYKCHQPWGNYIEKKQKTIYLKVWKIIQNTWIGYVYENDERGTKRTE